jgi:hypothetical protein
METTMNRAIAALALAAVFAAFPAAAQSSGWTQYKPNSTFFTTGYQMSQPIGDLGSYAGPSFRGLIFDGRSMLTKNMSAGLRFFWNRYNKTDSLVTQTTNSGGTVSGPVYHFADQFALEATGHYYFGGGPDSMILPYAGVGIGGVWSSTYQQTADLVLSQYGFFFIVTPELGMMINLAKGSTNAALHLAVHYNFTTASWGVGSGHVSDAQSLSETIGIAIAY